MNADTYWTAVGSVGTATGSFITLATIISTILLYRRQQHDEHAARIREDIRAIVGAADALRRALRDGAPIIAAAWSARNVIQETLPPGADLRKVQALLTEQGVGLSVAVVSWERSSEAEALRGKVAALADASRCMTGHLNVLSTAGEMLVDIADDARMTFLRLLTEEEVMAMFLESHRHVTDPDLLLNALAIHLHGNTAMYFVTRYGEVLNTLDQLITELAFVLSNLSAPQLVSVATAKSVITTETRTDEMRSDLTALSRFMSRATQNKVANLIDDLEAGVSKDAARTRLERQAQQGNGRP